MFLKAGILHHACFSEWFSWSYFSLQCTIFISVYIHHPHFSGIMYLRLFHMTWWMLSLHNIGSSWICRSRDNWNEIESYISYYKSILCKYLRILLSDLMNFVNDAMSCYKIKRCCSLDKLKRASWANRRKYRS